MAVTPEAPDQRASSPDHQLEWEARLGRPIGIAALIAAALIVASFVVQLPLLRDKTKNEAQTLHSVHAHATSYVISGLLQALALLVITALLWYLFRAAKHRRPQTPSFSLVLAVVGTLLFAIAGAVGPFVVRHYAAQFAASADQSNKHAKDLVDGGAAQVFGVLTPIAGLTFAFGMVMTNVNAMRAGLVSTFAGIIGIFSGLLFVLPLGPPQLLLFFWLLSVGIIVLDRWPGGRGPAWESGQVVRWPSAAERRGLGRAAPRGGPQQSPEPVAQSTEDEPQAASAAASRSSRKRKRKQGRKH